MEAAGGGHRRNGDRSALLPLAGASVTRRDATEPAAEEVAEAGPAVGNLSTAARCSTAAAPSPFPLPCPAPPFGAPATSYDEPHVPVIPTCRIQTTFGS